VYLSLKILFICQTTLPLGDPPSPGSRLSRHRRPTTRPRTCGKRPWSCRVASIILLLALGMRVRRRSESGVAVCQKRIDIVSATPILHPCTRDALIASSRVRYALLSQSVLGCCRQRCFFRRRGQLLRCGQQASSS